MASGIFLVLWGALIILPRDEFPGFEKSVAESIFVPAVVAQESFGCANEPFGPVGLSFIDCSRCLCPVFLYQRALFR